MKNQLLLLLFTMFFVSCFHEGNIEYRADLRKVHDKFVDHFPERITNDMSVELIMNRDTTSKCIYYMLLEYGKKDFEESFLDSIKDRSLSSFQASDTNIISVKRRIVTAWNPEKSVIYKKVIFNGQFYYPVPYFEKQSSFEYRGNVDDIYSDSTTSGLSEDFMIYVFEYSPGIYWEGLKPASYMPAECRNGYSKGIAVNEKRKVLIYWFVIW